MSHEQINNAIVKFESVILAGAPEFNTREEYVAHEAWMQERTNVSRSFKAALVAGNQEEARKIVAQAKAAYGIKF